LYLGIRGERLQKLTLYIGLVLVSPLVEDLSNL